MSSETIVTSVKMFLEANGSSFKNCHQTPLLHLWSVKKFLGHLMDLVPKIIIRNHCYICEKVPRQLMNLVSKIIIRNQCYFHFSFSSSSLTIFFFFINHYYIYNILVYTVVSPKSKITERRTKTDWIDGRTDWMNEYRIYNPIRVSSPGLLSLR